jgi:type II secretory pathway component GspD/PulD (secretin)
LPELQVLTEIFIIAVSHDFSCQTDSTPSALPSAGGNKSRQVALSQVARAAADAAGAGSFSLELDSPNDELGSVLNFIDSSQLGRVVSSPTILVAAGQDAVVKCGRLARVPDPNILDAEPVCWQIAS